ncbi:MAG: hypothetical protein J6Q30_07510 [Oscillospiraceae bacterium]|nr:hypothetical protein [Oscillospiraceae bacterium]
MKITVLGIGFDATLVIQLLKKSIPAHYVAISANSSDLKQYEGEKIRYIGRPSVDAAASRILSKVKAHTLDSDIVFLFSEITGKSQENIVCNIAEGIEDKTVISIVWYSKQKHGQQGLSDTLDRLGACSAVVAIPISKQNTLLSLAPEYAEQILRMYKLPYAHAEPGTGKRVIENGGLLHLAQEEVDIAYLDHAGATLPWGLSCINYSCKLDTLLEYSQSALLHLTIPPATPPKKLQYVCEYIFSLMGDESELNFHLSVDHELKNSMMIELLATCSITAKEAESWIY